MECQKERNFTSLSIWKGREICHSCLHNGPKLQTMHFMTVIKVKQTYGFLIYSYLKDRPFTAVKWDARICSIPPGNCSYFFSSNNVRKLMHLEFLSFTRIVFPQFFLFHLRCVVSRPWKVLIVNPHLWNKGGLTLNQSKGWIAFLNSNTLCGLYTDVLYFFSFFLIRENRGITLTGYIVRRVCCYLCVRISSYCLSIILYIIKTCTDSSIQLDI